MIENGNSLSVTTGFNDNWIVDKHPNAGTRDNNESYNDTGIIIADDIEPIYELCKRLIDDFEQLESIDYPKVMKWVRKKIEDSIDEYTVIYADEQKAGYYHFYKNDDGQFEIDDLYVFPEFQNQGIGSGVIRKCCESAGGPVMLYVFIANRRAVSLYKRLGFEIAETIQGSRYIMRNENSR